MSKTPDNAAMPGAVREHLGLSAAAPLAAAFGIVYLSWPSFRSVRRAPFSGGDLVRTVELFESVRYTSTGYQLLFKPRCNCLAYNPVTETCNKLKEALYFYVHLSIKRRENEKIENKK